MKKPRVYPLNTQVAFLAFDMDKYILGTLDP